MVKMQFLIILRLAKFKSSISNLRFLQRIASMQKKFSTFSGLALLALGLMHNNFAFAQTSADVIKVDGSSTVFPITEAVAEDFQASTKNTVKVTVGISGTGGGFKKFCRGDTDISNASRPISKSEMDACAKAGIKYIELPIAFDALTVVVNNKNTNLKQITVDQLKKMWAAESQNVVMNWNQIDPSFADQKLKLYGPGSDSGTFDYFTEAVNGKAKSSRGDYTASEDDNVLVQGVSRDAGALGYFGYAYYVANKNKLRALPIVNKQGEAVLPSPESVMNGKYNPLSRPLFIYVADKSLNNPNVAKFLEFYMKNAGKLATEVKYISLPANAYTIGLNHIQKKRFGTVYHGDTDVGLSIKEVLEREAKL